MPFYNTLVDIAIMRKICALFDNKLTNLNKMDITHKIIDTLFYLLSFNNLNFFQILFLLVI